MVIQNQKALLIFDIYILAINSQPEKRNHSIFLAIPT